MGKHKSQKNNNKKNFKSKHHDHPTSFEPKTTKTHATNASWEHDKLNAGFGHIIRTSGGTLMFMSDNGNLYNIAQSKENARICDEQLKCSVSTDMLSGFELVEVIKTLGKAGDPLPEGLAIAEKYKINTPFSGQALAQAEIISKEPIHKANYKDYTSLPFITIDPKTSKDFDDAFYLQKNDDGSYDLYVAIANVANFVRPGTQLFNEVMEKGISNYLGEMCYSMTPELLAYDVCSLNEGVERPSLVTKISYSPTGKIESYEISLGFIKNSKRLNYEQAEKIHENRDGAHIQFIQQKSMIDDAYELSDMLKKIRDNRGAMNIGSRKANFIMSDDKTKVLDITKDHLETSTEIIESFMIACNEVWGNFCQRANIPFIHRNHDPITPEKEETLREKLAQFSIFLPSTPSNNDLKNILSSVKGSNFEEPVTALMLKATGHAYYSVHNNGHSGLGISDLNEDTFTYLFNKSAKSGEEFIENSRREFMANNKNIPGISVKHSGGDATSYGHTTSPIRRGADLLNQIQMISVITTGKQFYSNGQLAQYCLHLNKQEITANKAEDEYDQLLTAIWAKDHIGEIYEGVVINHKPENILVKNLQKNIILDLPYSECAIPCKRNKKTGMVFGYQLGTEVSVQIFDAQLFPPRVYTSENLQKSANYPTAQPHNSSPTSTTSENFAELPKGLETDN